MGACTFGGSHNRGFVVLGVGDLISYTAEEGVRYLGEGKLMLPDSFPGAERNKLCLASKVDAQPVWAADIPPSPFHAVCRVKAAFSDGEDGEIATRVHAGPALCGLGYPALQLPGTASAALLEL